MLEVINVHAGYGRENILKGISFNIEGERIVLLGPNGSGKTTLVRAILGLLKIKYGSIKVFGRKTEDIRAELRLSTNYEPVYSLFPVSVKDLIDLYMYLKGGDAGYARKLLQDFGLESVSNKKLHQFSVGQRVIVCNILALASKSELLILDEPFENLDPVNLKRFVNLIQDYKGELLLITHYLPVLEYFSDYSLYFIFEGKVYGPLKPLRKLLESYLHLKDVENPILTVEVGGKRCHLSQEPSDYKLKDFIDITRIYEVLT